MSIIVSRLKSLTYFIITPDEYSGTIAPTTTMQVIRIDNSLKFALKVDFMFLRYLITDCMVGCSH